VPKFVPGRLPVLHSRKLSSLLERQSPMVRNRMPPGSGRQKFSRLLQFFHSYLAPIAGFFLYLRFA
jgi:hypothetical protein